MTGDGWSGSSAATLIARGFGATGRLVRERFDADGRCVSSVGMSGPVSRWVFGADGVTLVAVVGIDTPGGWWHIGEHVSPDGSRMVTSCVVTS